MATAQNIAVRAICWKWTCPKNWLSAGVRPRRSYVAACFAQQCMSRVLTRIDRIVAVDRRIASAPPRSMAKWHLPGPVAGRHQMSTGMRATGRTCLLAHIAVDNACLEMLGNTEISECVADLRKTLNQPAPILCANTSILCPRAHSDSSRAENQLLSVGAGSGLFVGSARVS